MDRLKNKVALITGANSGIGLASAEAFVREGAQVIMVGRDRAAITEAAKALGPKASAIRADVGSMQDLDRLYEQAAGRCEKIDIIFANAGVMTLSPFPATSEEHFDFEFNINVKGTFFTVQKGLPLIRDGGSVILTSSIANFRGSPGFNVYNATKAAVRSFARSWTNDLASRRIRVNSLSPGPTETPLSDKMSIPATIRGGWEDRVAQAVPMKRLGSPHETAQAAVFLASDESSFISGIDLCVDGGMGQV